jgi:hypothetical protein
MLLAFSAEQFDAACLIFYHLVVEFLERKIMSTKCAHEYECSNIVSELDLSFCQIFEL